MNYISQDIIDIVNQFSDEPNLLFTSKDYFNYYNVITDYILNKYKNKSLEYIIKHGSKLDILIAMNNLQYFPIIDPNDLAVQAIKRRFHKIYNFALKHGANDWHTLAEAAAEHGNHDILYDLIDKIINDPNSLDYIDLTDDIDPMMLLDSNSIATAAARGGHLDIVQYMMLNTILDPYSILNAAQQNGHQEIVDFIRSMFGI